MGYLPNSIEALIIKLAVISLGAIWSCASPDFGPESVTDRFKQIEPKLIFSVTSVAYNGKKHDHREKLIHVVNCMMTHLTLEIFLNDIIYDYIFE